MSARFWAFVRKTDTCWIWTGCVGTTGYGDMTFQMRKYKAHRFSWILHYGPIPAIAGTGYHGTCVLHRCDNRLCVRPDHLFLGTQRDNHRDMMAKKRMTLPPRRQGAVHGQAKLTSDQVIAIRNDSRPGNVIAREYAIGTSQVFRIRRHQTWKCLDSTDFDGRTEAHVEQ